DDLRIHLANAGERGETTVGAGNHALATYDVSELQNALAHQLRMLNVVGSGIHHSWHQNLVLWNPGFLPHCPFMAVTRVGGFEQDRGRLGLQDDVHDLDQIDVRSMWTFVV